MLINGFPFFKKKNQSTINHSELHLGVIPKHVAIIMDGNGRWAKKRGLPRIAGHKEGMDNVKRIVRVATKHKLEVLTLYAFSTENWKRPKKEVDFLMGLPSEFLSTYLPELIENNVRIQTIGDFEPLPSLTKQAMTNAIHKTKDNDGLILNIALNYGSRFEMLEAVKKIVEDVKVDQYPIENINEELFSNYLYTKHISDPDFLIRTSGEQRLSNFLLWQCAYSEFWFTDVLWPDFDEKLFEQALSDYEKRKRRFGGL
ncbi:isoprenyl transferase [Radiobacillus sp. PE A8.2]|uniref:isoprenyl transferase n=1 Tax=Radiobacillus sp. PE A8.2 TaxID=3380349 RepID=UPI003890C912